MSQNFNFYNSANNLRLNLEVKSTEETQSAGSVGLTFLKAPNKKFTAKINLYIPRVKIEEIIGENESFKDVTEVVLIYASKPSRKRQTIQMNTSKGKEISLGEDIYEAIIDFDPTEWFGNIEFSAFIVRSKTSKVDATRILTEKHSIIGTSKITKLFIEPFEETSGGDLEVVWSSEVDQNRESDILYWVDLDNRRLVLNKNMDQNLVSVFKYDGADNSKKKIRDAFFGPIATDAWEWIAREAITEATHEQEELEVDTLDPVYRGVITNIAKAKFGGEDESALEQFKDVILTTETRNEFINQELPELVQKIANLSTHYKEGIGEVFKS